MDRPSHLAAELLAGGVTEPDERGLMPLGEAREVLNSAQGKFGDEAERETLQDIHLLWAALLSLQDAEEFIREARTLDGRFEAADRNGAALHHRYGDDLLPWLLSFVDGTQLVTRGWPIGACICQVPEESVFEQLWSLNRVVASPTADAPAEPDGSAHGLVLEWIWTHPTLGFVRLAEKALAGSPRAKLMLKSSAQCHPAIVFRHVAYGLGDQTAREAFRCAGAPTFLDRSGMLTILNIGAQSADGWPRFDHPEASRRPHSLRLLAARGSGGNHWGIVLESIEGTTLENLRMRRYLHGNWAAPGGLSSNEGGVELALAPTGDAVCVTGPAGSLLRPSLPPVVADDAQISAQHPNEQSHFVSLLRAYLEEYPDAFWTPGAELAQLLELGGDAEIVVDTGVLADGAGAPLLDSNWQRPSDSPIFRSLVDAIVENDAALFQSDSSQFENAGSLHDQRS